MARYCKPGKYYVLLITFLEVVAQQSHWSHRTPKRNKAKAAHGTFDQLSNKRHIKFILQVYYSNTIKFNNFHSYYIGVYVYIYIYIIPSTHCSLFLFSHAVSNVYTITRKIFFPKKEKPKLQKYGFVRKLYHIMNIHLYLGMEHSVVISKQQHQSLSR